jgi:hypothetical protein
MEEWNALIKLMVVFKEPQIFFGSKSQSPKLTLMLMRKQQQQHRQEDEPQRDIIWLSPKPKPSSKKRRLSFKRLVALVGFVAFGLSGAS